MSSSIDESEIARRVKLEIKSEIKQEIINNSSQLNYNSDALRIKHEKIENFRLKQESLETAKVKEENVPSLTRHDTQPMPDPEQPEVERTQISHGLPKQTSKPRPKRPKRNALSLEKIASINTEDMFMYNSENSLNSPIKKLPSSLQELSACEPIIETEEHRYPAEFNQQAKRKKRINIDVLLDKYESGVGILNEDGSIEVREFSDEKKLETLPHLNEDKELDLLLSRPKKLKLYHGDVPVERSEIDEITEKYDFFTQNTSQIHDSMCEIEEASLNRSISKDFTVRIKCSRSLYSFQTRYDSPFQEIITQLAQKLDTETNKIMLTLKDDTIGASDTPLSLNLEECAIVDAIILSTTFVSPTQPNQPRIKIKIQFSKQLGGLVPMIAPVNTELKGILDQICESKDLTHIKFQLQFDGEVLDLSSTLLDYEIEDDDVIDAIVVT